MILVSAYFSGSETGMMTLNRYRLRHKARSGNRAARRVEKLLRRPDRLISLVLIGNNLVNILASALATIVGMRMYGDAGVAIGGININDGWKSIERQVSHSPPGRIVLFRDSLDDAVAMLRVREAWRMMTEKKEFTKENLLRAADEIYFVPEGTPLNVQLVKFQRNKKKVGLVVDEYGDIKGLVTIEDILEEIVGDFTTSMSPSLAEEVMPQSDGSVLIEGSANVREINKAFNWHLPQEEARTINGMLLEELEEIPQAGTRIQVENYDVDILDVQDNMVKQVRITPQQPLKSTVNS